MNVTQWTWTAERGWSDTESAERAGLALVFGSKEALADAALLSQVRQRCPSARLLGCSTAGEIRGTQVLDGAIVVSAVELATASFRGACTRIASPDGFDAGARLAAELPAEGLGHVFVLADSLSINGTALVAGLASRLPAGVRISGGLAGDGDRFGGTVVLWDELLESAAVAVGFYGDRLRVGCGSLGGWDCFGPERLITRSRGNVLDELDGQSALLLYKRYLGEQAAGLPATALLFPLSLRHPDGGEGVVRTVLAIDEASGSMTFAGDVPQGSYARLMKANFDRLVDGAMGAARASQGGLGGPPAELAVLISCVGRKMVLGQRVEEEVEGVREVLGAQPALAGFYSYGEISPVAPHAGCALHNQTMTITTFTEV